MSKVDFKIHRMVTNDNLFSNSLISYAIKSKIKDLHLGQVDES